MPGRTYLSGTAAKEDFTGHELDVETGLHYAGARYLDAAIGRWLAVDPMADEFPAWSPYNYVTNNPLSLIDPDGRACIGAEGESAKSCSRVSELYDDDKDEPNRRTNAGRIFEMYRKQVLARGLATQEATLAEYINSFDNSTMSSADILDAIFNMALTLTEGDTRDALRVATSASITAGTDGVPVNIMIGGNSDTAHHFFANADYRSRGVPGFVLRYIGNEHERRRIPDQADIIANNAGIKFGEAIVSYRAYKMRMQQFPLRPGPLGPARLPQPSTFLVPRR